MALVARVTSLPPCAVHSMRGEDVPAVYDAKTIVGPWAFLCEGCMCTYGVGLGTGRGQRLVLIPRREGDTSD